MSQVDYTNKDRDNTVVQLKKVEEAVRKGNKTVALKLLNDITVDHKTLQPFEKSAEQVTNVDDLGIQAAKEEEPETKDNAGSVEIKSGKGSESYYARAGGNNPASDDSKEEE